MGIIIEPHRCFWCNDSQIYRDYHDTEWGFPVIDDTRLFEKICLEVFQSGLSWITILKKRENLRLAFKGFDIESVARLGQQDIDRLMVNQGIIRHRGKIEAVINNAKCAEKLLDSQSSLATYFWQFEPQALTRHQLFDADTLKTITQSKESIALAKALKQFGWKFVGPTTIYAFMQSMGLVNDHEQGCHVREAVLEARRELKLPG
jgi:DNA-3-methyladenine glycosylase I